MDGFSSPSSSVEGGGDVLVGERLLVVASSLVVTPASGVAVDNIPSVELPFLPSFPKSTTPTPASSEDVTISVLWLPRILTKRTCPNSLLPNIVPNSNSFSCMLYTLCVFAPGDDNNDGTDAVVVVVGATFVVGVSVALSAGADVDEEVTVATAVLVVD